MPPISFLLMGMETSFPKKGDAKGFSLLYSSLFPLGADMGSKAYFHCKMSGPGGSGHCNDFLNLQTYFLVETFQEDQYFLHSSHVLVQVLSLLTHKLKWSKPRAMVYHSWRNTCR